MKDVAEVVVVEKRMVEKIDFRRRKVEIQLEMKIGRQELLQLLKFGFLRGGQLALVIVVRELQHG